MASGDTIIIKHNAGDGTTFSYTAAVDFVITNMTGTNWSSLMGDNWIISTQGCYQYLSAAYAQSGTSSTGGLRLVVPQGTILNHTDTDFDQYGCWLVGIEL